MNTLLLLGLLWALGTGIALPEVIRRARSQEPRRLVLVKPRRATPLERAQAWDGLGSTADRLWSA